MATQRLLSGENRVRSRSYSQPPRLDPAMIASATSLGRKGRRGSRTGLGFLNAVSTTAIETAPRGFVAPVFEQGLAALSKSKAHNAEGAAVGWLAFILSGSRDPTYARGFHWPNKDKRGVQRLLADGAILCDVVNKICPGIIQTVLRAEDASDVVAVEHNVPSFCAACQRLGVPKRFLFGPTELGTNMKRVISCILALRGIIPSPSESWDMLDTVNVQKVEPTKKKQGVRMSPMAQAQAKTMDEEKRASSPSGSRSRSRTSWVLNRLPKVRHRQESSARLLGDFEPSSLHKSIPVLYQEEEEVEPETEAEVQAAAIAMLTLDDTSLDAASELLMEEEEEEDEASFLYSGEEQRGTTGDGATSLGSLGSLDELGMEKSGEIVSWTGSEDAKPQTRSDAIEAFVHAEGEYTSNVRLLVGHYLKRLQATNVLPKEDIAKLFLNIDAIFKVNQALYQDLSAWFHNGKDNAESTYFGRTLALFFSFGRNYQEYVHGLPNAVLAWDRMYRERRQFRATLDGLGTESLARSRMHVLVLLATPVARLLCYASQMEAVYATTPPEHADMPALKRAVASAKTLVEESGAAAREGLGMLIVARVARLVEGSDDLVIPGRRLLAEATFSKSISMVGSGALNKSELLPHPRKFFLFNDMLMWCRGAGAGGKGLFRVRGRIPVAFLRAQTSRIQGVEELMYGVEVVNMDNNKSFVFGCKDEALAKEWLDKITQLISKLGK